MENSPFDFGINSKSDYAITLQIPSFKKVNYKGIYKAYSLFSVSIQKEILEEYYNTSLKVDDVMYSSAELFFEEHQDGRIHCHTFFLNVSYDLIYNIQKNFCHNILKIRPKQYQQVFNFFKPDSMDKWRKYCRKFSISDLQADLDELNKKNLV